MSKDSILRYRIIAENDQLKRDLAKAKGRLNRFKNQSNAIGRQIKGTLAGMFAVGTMVSFGKSVIETTAKFQKMEAVLTNTLGSGSEAQKAMQMITEFASKTPFQVDGLTGAFVKLANQGFVPTAQEMRKLGDLAASTGKDFDQLAEAVIDAQVGEFERLKEFGIRASKEGDRVKFTFKGVTKEVDFAEGAIQKYILGLGDAVGVSGSMAAISETVGGKISNLEDNFTQLKKTIGDQSSGVIASMIDFSNTLLEGFTRLAAGDLFKDKDPFDLGKIIGKNLQIAEGQLDSQIKTFSDKLQEMKDKITEIKSAINDPNISVTNAAKLAQIQEKLNDEVFKYTGIILELKKRKEGDVEATKKQTDAIVDQIKATKMLLGIRTPKREHKQSDPFKPKESPIKEGFGSELQHAPGMLEYLEQWKRTRNQVFQMQQEMQAVSEQVANAIVSSIDASFNILSDGLATGDIEGAFINIKQVFGQGLIEAGKALIGWGKLMEGIKKALSAGIFGGPAAFVAGGLAIAAGIALKASAARAAGSISSGLGGSSRGPSGSFRNNLQGQSSITITAGDFRLRGSDIIGSLKAQSNRNNRNGGLQVSFK